jgi:CRISPR-associated protein (TIGR03984 family)
MRALKRIETTFTPLTEIPTGQAAFDHWLVEQAQTHGLKYALAHADDGVIWGHFAADWHWSSGAFNQVSPPFRIITLQQLRLFGAEAELFVWRTSAGWAGRVIVDRVGISCDYFDEPQYPWGRPEGEMRDGFVLMREGQQGLLHTPPIPIAQMGQLQTRTYFNYDEDGCVKIIASRLWAQA